MHSTTRYQLSKVYPPTEAVPNVRSPRLPVLASQPHNGRDGQKLRETKSSLSRQRSEPCLRLRRQESGLHRRHGGRSGGRPRRRSRDRLEPTFNSHTPLVSCLDLSTTANSPGRDHAMRRHSEPQEPDTPQGNRDRNAGYYIAVRIAEAIFTLTPASFVSADTARPTSPTEVASTASRIAVSTCSGLFNWNLSILRADFHRTIVSTSARLNGPLTRRHLASLFHLSVGLGLCLQVFCCKLRNA